MKGKLETPESIRTNLPSPSPKRNDEWRSRWKPPPRPTELTPFSKVNSLVGDIRPLLKGGVFDTTSRWKPKENVYMSSTPISPTPAEAVLRLNTKPKGKYTPAQNRPEIFVKTPDVSQMIFESMEPQHLAVRDEPQMLHPARSQQDNDNSRLIFSQLPSQEEPPKLSLSQLPAPAMIAPPKPKRRFEIEETPLEVEDFLAEAEALGFRPINMTKEKEDASGKERNDNATRLALYATKDMSVFAAGLKAHLGLERDMESVREELLASPDFSFSGAWHALGRQKDIPAALRHLNATLNESDISLLTRRLRRCGYTRFGITELKILLVPLPLRDKTLALGDGEGSFDSQTSALFARFWKLWATNEAEHDVIRKKTLSELKSPLEVLVREVDNNGSGFVTPAELAAFLDTQGIEANGNETLLLNLFLGGNRDGVRLSSFCEALKPL
eukprot:TRINITY_DN9130_c0_g1_i1.p1 TRINITY_DN9130_c0_g1~~TRINITY_DN9130_c0_g1_i1.p1  ORF type:complete len:442 (+),score=83.78 TRINITY_DN9130_c0_g1_i1:112-1437(+)